MERLFVEVFDRKSRIESQLYQQFESYGQSLAYNIIADGGCPPPWLWEMGPSASVFSNNGDLSKEQLISEILFPFPATKNSLPDQYTNLNLSDMKHGSKCNPSKLLGGVYALDKSLGEDLRDNSNILLNQDNNSECNVFESRSEIDVMDWVPSIRSHQICSGSLVCKMDEMINGGRKGRAENQKERKTMSRIESEDVGLSDSFSSANKDLEMVNGSVGRVTRSRSRLSAQKQNSSGKSFGAKASTLVKDFANLPPECRTDMHPLNLADLNRFPSDNINDVDMLQVYSSNAENEMLGKAMFDKSSRCPGIPALVEPLMANLNGIGSCQTCLNETPNISVSVSQTQEGPSRRTMSNNASHPKQMQVQQCDVSNAELVNGVVEVDMVSNEGIEKGSLEFIVDDDCECASHCDSIRKLPEMPRISSALSPAGDGVPISCKDSCSNKVDNPSITRETSPRISKTHSGGRQLSVKLKTVVGSEALQKVESSPIVGRAHHQFDISEESGCKECSAVTLNSRKRSACCDVVSTEIDDCQSGKKGSPCLQDSLMEIPNDVGESLAIEANLTGKVDRLPMELQGGREEIYRVADPGFFMVPASNVQRLSETPACLLSCPESSSSKHACSAKITGSMVGSYLGCLDNTPMLRGSEEPLLEDPLKCLTKNKSMDYHLEEKINSNLSDEETSSGTNSLRTKDPSIKKTSENAERKSTQGHYFLRSSNFCNNADLLKSGESIISCSMVSSMLQEADKTETFEDIKQQIEHKCKAKSTAEAILVQFSSKLTDCYMQSSVPPETKQSHMLQNGSDSNSSIHDLVILPREVHTYNSRDEKKSCNLILESEFDHSSGGSATLFASNEAKEPCDAPQPFYSCSFTGLSCADDEKTKYDETMPTFERFNIDIPYLVQDSAVSDIADIPSLAKERIFVLEQLRQSRVLLTPNYVEPSKLYEVDGISDDLDSSSLGLLENMKLDYSREHTIADTERLSASCSNSLMGIGCKYGSQPDHPVLERSHSVSSTSVGFCSETRNPPLTPPVLKLGHGKLSGKRSSSSEKMNSKPELICFRIDENSSTTEENADFFQVNFSARRTSPRDIGYSKNSTSLSDETAIYQNTTGFISNLMELEVRDSLESVISDADSSLLCLGKGKSKIENTEHQKHADKENRFWKTVRSISNMSVKSKVSRKSSKRIRETQSMGRSGKPSISDIASFGPHVQQKQGGPLLHGKKEIKVKALEAAEVAKRLEVKKQIERETRKATVKLQRERLEQENAKQLKLKQKHEEEKRKKEVDNGGRKRQRKEEDQKAKQCKRQCKAQSRTLNRGLEDKMRFQEEQDFRKKAVDDKQNLCTKITNVKGQKELEEVYQLTEKVQQYTINIASNSPKYADDNFKAVNVLDDGKLLAKGVDCSDVFQEAVENLIPVLRTEMHLRSYEISPYQSSDDEEVEEYSWREQKFVPLWARRESLGQIIRSNQYLDPKEIFSRKQSFSLSKVLCSRVLTRQWR
ncbi:hypothetical protein HPP92_017580 [Vanilla planifolia]|uniref:Inner centromere protein ARK-binding domain-containing protein n=1 Tax=Vanilla planifolia TaxID=51239 RepID=A0A835QIA4_VANPL|nr:hypothetical protein HPP92_017580 [Vanilla planifolia]